MVKVQENPKTKQLWVTIPKQIAEFKQWKKGTKLQVLDNDRYSVIFREEGK